MAALVSRTVAATDCGHVLFVFPNGGLQVSPRQVYSIRLRQTQVRKGPLIRREIILQGALGLKIQGLAKLS